MDLERSCTRTILELPWLLNESLPAADRRQVREHLIHCPGCREELARTRAALEIFTASERIQQIETESGIAAMAVPKTGRGRILRRLLWSAAATVIVAVFGGLWAVHEPASESTPVSRAARSDSRAEEPMPDRQLIFKNDFEAGDPSGWRQHL